MIVPFPPGGVADIVGRPLASQMEKTLKQPVVVVNRTGAGGAVGMASVAKAASDGYTILMGLSSISIFPVSDRINGKTPSYEMKDFAPIALITADPTVLVVSADSPWNNLKEFVDSAKADPGKINYSSSGVYGTLHVGSEKEHGNRREGRQEGQGSSGAPGASPAPGAPGPSGQAASVVVAKPAITKRS